MGLEEARVVIEGDFLSAGDILGEAVAGIGTMIATVDKLAAAVDPAGIRQTTQDLGIAIAKLTDLPKKQAQHRSALQVMTSEKLVLLRCIADMRRSLDYMGAFAINIKIAASGLVDGDVDFGLFAQDISNCIELGRTELDLFKADIGRLSAQLQKALGHGLALERRCGALIPSIAEALSASATVIGEHHQRVATAAREAGDVARNVHMKVGQVLAALQIGDSTRQRIEHIQGAIGLVAPSAAGLPSASAAAFEDVVEAVLAVQLRATMTDFSDAIAEINSSMRGLAEDLQDVLRLRDLAYGREAGEKDGVLRHLERRVKQALDLVVELESADKVAAETGAAVAEATRGLMTRVQALQAIKSNVYYMAVNTTLKSSRIGEKGRPVAVIAVELHAHSGHLESSTGDCLQILQRLGDAAAGLADLGAFAGENRQTFAAQQALDAASQRLRAAGDQTEADVALLADQGEAMLGLLNQPSRWLSQQGRITDALQAAADSLAGPGPAGVALDAAARGAVEEFMAQLWASYTMAREREVHDGFAQAWGLGMDAPALAQAAV